MGGGGHKRKGGRGGRPDNKRGRADGQGAGNGDWRYESMKTYRNEKFETFYKAQGIVPESEWDSFIAVLQEQLPVTFRVNPLAADAATARHAMVEHPEWSKPFQLDDGRTVEAPRQLAFLPGAWQLGYGKPDLRKNKNLKAFHEWLQVLTADGTLSRQEAVSMIPPLLLGVQPHHVVLDMCAAPGSKTAQLLESLHSGELGTMAPAAVGAESAQASAGASGSSSSSSSGATPEYPWTLHGRPATGMVVANDSDSKRAYLLVHQCQRIGSPNLIVTCHDAQLFPNLNKGLSAEVRAALGALDAAEAHVAAATGTAVDATGKKAQRVPGFFDRVLADVPCSGDGTGRKNAEAILRWVPANGLALHPLQVQITMRGLGLLKTGGYLCYSTCSLSPIEDEAVVAEVLRRCEGSVELVDTSAMLPGLKRLPGLHSWTVYDRDMRACPDGYDAALKPNEHGHVPAGSRKLLRSHFPPSLELAREVYHLERCMRVTPHLQDTGGFFICLLHKKAPLPSAQPWAGADPLLAQAGATATGGTNANAGSAKVVEGRAATATAAGEDAGVDSEDEIDRAQARPLGNYAPAGPGSAANAIRHPRAGADAGAAGAPDATPTEATPAASDDADDVAGAAMDADDAAEGDDDEGSDGDEEAGDKAGASAAAPAPAPQAWSSKPLSQAGKVNTDAGTGKQYFQARPPKGQAAAGAGSSAAAGVGGAPARNLDRDSKGRVLAGRFEMTTYTAMDAPSVSDVVTSYGLRPDFPRHLLYTRNDSGKGGDMVLMSQPVAAAVLPQQKTITGDGRVKVVNSGIKVLAENRDKARADVSGKADTKNPEAGAAAPAPASAAPGSGGAGLADYRLLQEGLLLMLPYMTRRVVHASGREIATVLRYRGGFAPSTVYPPRLARALEAIPPGSFAMVLNPALDGLEEDQEAKDKAGASATAAAAAFAAANATTAEGSNLPQAVVPLSAKDGIAPALRAHYVLSQEGTSLHFSPAMRIWPGANPLSRAAMCMWKGRQRFNVMLHTSEAAALLTTLQAAGYASPELTPEQAEVVAAMPIKKMPVPQAHFDGRDAAANAAAAAAAGANSAAAGASAAPAPSS